MAQMRRLYGRDTYGDVGQVKETKQTVAVKAPDTHSGERLLPHPRLKGQNQD